MHTPSFSPPLTNDNPFFSGSSINCIYIAMAIFLFGSLVPKSYTSIKKKGITIFHKVKAGDLA